MVKAAVITANMTVTAMAEAGAGDMPMFWRVPGAKSIAKAAIPKM
jgi:hypothetical protein